MSKYITTVVRMPEESEAQEIVKQALNALRPYQTGGSMEDEMTILELIENHPDFADYIATDAREQAAKLHEKAKEAGALTGF